MASDFFYLGFIKIRTVSQWNNNKVRQRNAYRILTVFIKGKMLAIGLL